MSRAVGEILIVGAGVTGAALAYHLTRLGHDRITVVDARDRHTLSGSTGLAPGFIGRLSGSPGLTELAMDSVATYRELPGPVFRPVGSLQIATSKARLKKAHKEAERAADLGIEATVIDGEQAVRLAPELVDPAHTLGALHVPGDGAADPVALTHALVTAAEQAGAEFLWNTPVRDLEIVGRRVIGVRTGERNTLRRAKKVVLAAGIWGPVLAAKAGIRLPMVAVQHPYVFTPDLDTLDDTPIDEPIVLYPDEHVYTRRHGTRYGLGSYAHRPLPFTPSTVLSAELPFDHADFGSAIEDATRLIPAFRGTPLGRRLNGVYALTPDELPIAGPATGLPGLWFAEACWVTQAGGVGKYLAELLLDKREPLASLAPERFDSWSADRVWDTALENYAG
ncbi:FAD-binding oxidoreductase [Pseudonocardiaceae bacterium YIM PH 21723]|nr:FAD-binding oxidoreductase [Pseudonocardiaceae bacterium YIM PH 21723]